ncbi:sugar phosphate isomerase/epimerase [Paenibacillaceae bacterium]|nr:sugar phosphate isomerase/epimerase [Paenibacillaceae bacterium]
MKLSVFTVATPDLTPEALCAAAKSAGIDGVEWRYKETPASLANEPYSFWGNNLATIAPSAGTAGLEPFKRAAAEHGIAAIGVTPYLTVGDLEATEQVLEAARHLGASMIRLGVPAYDRSRHYNDLLEAGRNYLQGASLLCRQYGIKGLVELHHGTIAASPSAGLRLIEGFDPETVGVLYDPGNMIHEGFENYRMGMELLGPYLAHVHVKNAGWFPAAGSDQAPGTDSDTKWQAKWVGIRGGIVPWPQVIADLKAVGYKGFLGVEDFSGELDSAAMLHSFADYMRELLHRGE